MSQGETAGDARRQIGVTEKACCCLRKQDGGMKAKQLRWLKDLEQETGQLKYMMGDRTLDIAIPTEAKMPKSCARPVGGKARIGIARVGHVREQAPVDRLRWMRYATNHCPPVPQVMWSSDICLNSSMEPMTSDPSIGTNGSDS